MQLTSYSLPAAFLAVAEAELAQDEAANSLMLGIAYRIRADLYAYGTQPYLATVSDEQGLALCALMTPPHRLHLCALRPDAGAVQCGYCTPGMLLAQDLVDGGWPVPGVLARTDLAEQFAGVWSRLTGRSATRGMSERIHWLRQVIHPRYSPGRFRQAQIADLPLLTRWVEEFSMEAIGEHDADVEARVRARIEAGDYYVWEDVVDDQLVPVSMAAKTRPLPRGVSIGPVYTPPALRGRGYASSCVARLSQHLLDSGWQYCALFTDLANPTSNHIYHAIGYEPIGDMQVYDFG